MVGYIYLITDTTNGMQYTGKHHYDKEGELDPNYHGSGVIIRNIYKKRPETLKEEYIKTCYSEEEMNNDEKYYIKLYDTLWPNGYNLTEGGDGGIPCEEARRKMSESKKNISEETRKKLSESLKGRPSPNKGKQFSEETRKKLSESHKGKKLSDETKRKMSEKRKGRHHTEESKRKMSESKKNISDETRRKMSESKKNISDETRKKISDSKKGKQLSEEHKQKLRESAKKRKLQKQLQSDGCLPLW